MSEDFGKKFLTREYGNYDKYELNSVSEDIEKGENEVGEDKLYKNYREMNLRLDTYKSDKFKK
jgi:hypothetical protein